MNQLNLASDQPQTVKHSHLSFIGTDRISKLCIIPSLKIRRYIHKTKYECMFHVILTIKVKRKEKYISLQEIRSKILIYPNLLIKEFI